MIREKYVLISFYNQYHGRYHWYHALTINNSYFHKNIEKLGGIYPYVQTSMKYYYMGFQCDKNDDKRKMRTFYM